MLFEDESTAVPKELLNQLKQKAHEVAGVLKLLRQQNEQLKRDADELRRELEQEKERTRFFESERQELREVVEELLKEFEQVS
ncbi:MAG: hypothetical protein P8Z49_00410 [Acidobacteriota bacterium]|jgi:Spy/CpxP family protein refolding chaperone